MKLSVINSYREEKREVFNKRLGIIFNGEYNLKPTIIENLIDQSPTAYQCANIYASFLNGSGFKEDFSGINLSSDFWKQETINDFLTQVCESVSRHGGAFIHVRYNANYEKESFKVIPYPLCRVGEKDSRQYSGRIVVSQKGWGRYVRKQDLDIFNAYNPHAEIIEAQVASAGGWKNYKGQVFFFKLEDKYTYPSSPIEPAYLYADTEHRLAVYHNRTVKKGFKNVTFIYLPECKDDEQRRAIKKTFELANDVEGTASYVLLEYSKSEYDKVGKDSFMFENAPDETKADQYIEIKRSAANFIRKCFKNIPPQIVDYVEGKLGNSSGEDLIKAQAIYNAITAKDRNKIERLFTELFRNFKEELGDNFSIKPYALLEDGTIEEKTENDDSIVDK